MTLPMDMRILADNAKVGFVFAGRGIAPDGAASWFLPRIVGISQALEWVLTARVFRAQEALDGGLVKQACPPRAATRAGGAEGHRPTPARRGPVAAKIAGAGRPPCRRRVSRGLLWRMLGADHPMAAHRADSAAIFELGRKADSREGVMAFLEKRGRRPGSCARRRTAAGYPWWDNPTYEGD